MKTQEEGLHKPPLWVCIEYVYVPILTRVLILCVEFPELSHLACDLSQAEKKINVVTISANAPNDNYFNSK